MAYKLAWIWRVAVLLPTLVACSMIPLSMTTGVSATRVVRPTAIVLVPLQGQPTASARVPSPTPLSGTGWKTFSESQWGVAVDYPPSWSVVKRNDGATFTSLQNTTIVLTLVSPGVKNDEIRIPNQRCSTRTNAHGLTARLCVQTVSFSYSAQFTLKLANGTEQGLTLTTLTRTTADVFQTMFDSVRPFP